MYSVNRIMEVKHFQRKNLFLGSTFVLILTFQWGLCQKTPFVEHYDSTRKNNRDNNYETNSYNPWTTSSDRGSRGGDTNTGSSYSNNQGTVYNYTTKFDDKELRDNPDHDNINWLSPNPFAKPSSSYSSENGSDRNKYYNNNNNSSSGFSNGNNPRYTGSSGSGNQNFNTYSSDTSNRGDRVENPSWDRDRDRDLRTYTQPYDTKDNNNAFPRSKFNQVETLDEFGRSISSGSTSSNDNNVIPVGPQQPGIRGEQNSGSSQRSGNMNVHPNYENSNYPGAVNNPGIGPASGSGSAQGGSRNDAVNNQYINVGPASNYPGYTQSNSPNSGSDSRRGGGNTDGNYPGSGSNFPAINRNFPESESSYPRSGSNYPGSNYGSGSGTRSANYPNYPGRGSFDPGYPNVNVWNEHWSTTTYRPTALGVLGRWRPDLQGQQRPEDINQVPQPVYVTTSFGRVQGFRVKIYDGPKVPLPARPGVANVDKEKASVSSFVGIPYARSPVQEGRFRPPRSHTGWQLLQAVEFAPACPQPARFFGYTQGVVTLDEDCLYLNVFSPDVGSGVKGSPFPVIFYIHDGDFIHGASNQFPPHQLVAWYDVVVVTVNFRLGALGFLSTADEHSPGNYGMLDLSMALQWVHNNIRSFNGDPERITLVGLGSGAAAAGLLMVSPRTRNLIKNVVALEGAPTADWAAIVDKYRLQNTTQLYSYKLGCWQEWDTTSWKMVQCLRTRSWQELANLELEPDVGTFPWSPAVDRNFRVPKDDTRNDWKEESWRFLPDSPYNLLKSSEYPFVKYMTGYSRQCAADLLHENKTLSPHFIVTRPWFDKMIHRWVKKYNYTLNPEGVYSAIRYAYTYWPDPYNTTHLREEYVDFLSDALYRAPVDETVKLLLARGIQVHSYLLNYTLEALRLPQWREVPRGLEYYLLSGAPFMDPEFFPERLRVGRSAWTEGDRNMSHFFMNSVANMAHYGHPTPKEILGIYWERATPSDLKYLALNGTNNSTIQRNYRQRELTFWSEYMPSVVGRFVPTYPPTTEYWWEPNEPLQIAFWTVSGICLILIVVLVACCLLWRTAKKQRDRIYDDLGLGSEPLGLGTIVGDEVSEYAETVKTENSMDSGVKLGQHPNPSSHNSMSMNMHQMQMFSSQPQIHNHQSNQRDRFPTPIKRAVRDRGGDRDTPQTQV